MNSVLKTILYNDIFIYIRILIYIPNEVYKIILMKRRVIYNSPFFIYMRRFFMEINMKGINEIICGIYFIYGLFSIFHITTQIMNKSYIKLSLVCFVTSSLMLLTIPTLFEIYINKVFKIYINKCNLISYMICLIYLILWIIEYIKIIKEDLQ